MIFTEDQKDELVQVLNDNFKSSKPAVRTNNGEIIGVSINIKEIDTMELTQIKSISNSLDCDVNLKRSGTGISVLFS
jgi:hypothetical protein